jgi:hypothetical protein
MATMHGLGSLLGTGQITRLQSVTDFGQCAVASAGIALDTCKGLLSACKVSGFQCGHQVLHPLLALLPTTD